MYTFFCQKGWLKLAVLGSLVAAITAVSPDSVGARGAPAELTQKMVTALHSPSTAAELIQALVAANPQTAAATAETAIQVAPSFAALLTAAAVYSAPQQTANIASAMVRVAPKLAQKIQTSANVASALTAQPDQSVTIIGAEVVTQPALASTIVTASVTICNLLHACPRTSVEALVQAAIAADREVAEEVVGAAVYLVPAQAGAIIAAADEVLTVSAQAEERTASAAADALLIAPGEQGAWSLQPVREKPSISSQVIAPPAASSEGPDSVVVARVKAPGPLPDLSGGRQQTSKPKAAPVVVQDTVDQLLREAKSGGLISTAMVEPVPRQVTDNQPGQESPGLDRRSHRRPRQAAPRPFPASPHF